LQSSQSRSSGTTTVNDGANSGFAPTTPMSGGRSSEQHSSDDDETAEEIDDGDEGEFLGSGVTDGESCDQDEEDEDAAEDEEASGCSDRGP